MVLFLSVLLLVPCFWHSRIQAGDLGSHVYNAWLAQLIERKPDSVPGLLLVRQWNNVLFDVVLLRCANIMGFAAAERFVVSLAVLTFFWGGFSLLAQFSRRLPWQLTPLLAILTYGYVFHMGFMNYYISLGLALFVIALVWRGGVGNWCVAALLAGLCFTAHPIGFVLGAAVSAYVVIQQRVGGWLRFVLPTVAIGGMWLLKFYFASHTALEPDWRNDGFWQLLGQDQMNLFGDRYVVLSWVVLAWGVLCALAAGYDWLFRQRKASGHILLTAELYTVSWMATFFLPENFRVSLYAGWIGLLVSRLTLVTALFGLAILATLRTPRWTAYGSSLCALVFFGFLYHDTGKLDRVEKTAREAVLELRVGTRVVATANPPKDWRIQFIYHSIERACVGKCFSYANYEPSSRQFRVRASPGNFYVTDSVDQADDMASGDYVVSPKDLPLTSLYQCDSDDFTQICAKGLRAGQKTEDPEAEPGPIPTEEEEPAEN